MRAAPQKPTSNLNTWIGIGSAVVSTIIGGSVMLMITSARESSKKQVEATSEQRVELTKIVTALPYLGDGIKNTEAGIRTANEELKDAKSKMITRDELTNKHKALQDNIDKGQAQVHELGQKVDKIQDDFWHAYQPAPTPTPRRR